MYLTVKMKKDYLEKYILKIINTYCIKNSEWNCYFHEDFNCNWTFFKYKKKMPTSGIKLHISSTSYNSVKILEKVIPIIFREKVSFKVTSSIKDLHNLNNGKAGETQVGKFLTLYPYTNNQAVNLGIKIDKSIKEYFGPIIPYENSLGYRSSVYYRYGSFKNKKYQKDNGEIVNAMIDDNKKIIIESRKTKLDRSVDPFIKKEIKVWSKPIKRILKNRYLIISITSTSVKGYTWLAMDLESNDMPAVIIKQANHGIREGNMKEDARARLRREIFILNQLKGNERFPQIVDSWEEDHESYLVYKQIEGINLRSLIISLSDRGESLSEKKISEYVSKISEIIKVLHNKNIIFRDLSPANIIIDKNENMFLIDFELASYIGEIINIGAGTPGYSKMSNQIPTTKDDIYSIGAILFFILTKIDLSTVSLSWNPLINLNKIDHSISPNFKQILNKCLRIYDNNESFTIEDMQKLLFANLIPNISNQKGKRTSFPQYLKLADGIGNLICKYAQKEKNGIYWITRHFMSYGAASRDIYIGSSGIGIFLLDLFNATKKRKYLSYAKKIANWLVYSNTTIGRKKPLPGLYFGESGVGLFYLKLYASTSDSQYLDYAKRQSDLVIKSLTQSPDLMNGLAGVGLYHLILYDITNEIKFFNRAKQICKKLINSMKLYNGQDYGWKLPEKLGPGLGGICFLGMAHGSAGIGLFLLEMVKTNNNNKYIEIINHISNSLIRYSKPILDNERALIWPYTYDNTKFGIYWCHGVTGIASYFLRSFQITNNQEHLDLTLKAYNTIVKHGKYIGTTQCHGLAGNIEFLIDLYGETKNKEILRSAYELGEILLSYKVHEGKFFKWPSEDPNIFSWDYMVGNSGIGSCLLRLANPILTNTLSRNSFK
jgi:serine/threonine protein kinase